MTARSFSSLSVAVLSIVVTAWFSPASANARAAADPTVALIARQSQQFSDASASGDSKVLARLLDDDVAFVDESGEVLTKKDIVGDGSTPPPNPVKTTLVQTDLVVRVHGSVAVTTFTDNATVLFHGQKLRPTFRSTEVWLRERDGWRMISSQTIALQIDPPAIVLPSHELDAYVGRYSAGPGYDVAIARSGTGLSASVNGGTPVTLHAEVRDVFFAAGQPRVRRIFERDPSGAVIGFVSRREGHDLVLKRVA